MQKQTTSECAQMHEHVVDAVFQLEVRIVSVGTGQTQLHHHNLRKRFLKNLKQNKTAARESGSSAKARGSSCCSHVPRPAQFHKRLHGVAEELLEFNEPVRLTGNYRMAPIPGLKHGCHTTGQHRLQKWGGRVA
jgi:hypothetical protein